MNQDLKGLTQLQVQQKISQGLVNTSTPKTARTYWQIISENLFNIINILLFVVAMALAFIGKHSDAFVYILVVVVNTLVGLVQEVSAKQKLDKIASLTKPKTRVMRDGIINEIASEQIVQSDLIILGTGDLVPADGKVLQGKLDLDESLLTGESDLVHRTIGENIKSGSMVVSGSAYLSADQVGPSSFANQLTKAARSYHRRLTPLQKEINLFMRVLFLVSFTIGLLLNFSAVITQTPFEEGLQIAAVVLGIIPNSLIVMINLAYAIGGVNLLGHGALVQRLNAVESLSNVDVLCLDKTGTLTTNRLILKKINFFGVTENQIKKIMADYVASLGESNKTVEAIAAFCDDIGAKQNSIYEVPFASRYKWGGLSWLEESDSNNESKAQTKNYILGASDVLKNNLKLTKEQLEITNKAQQNGHRVLYFVSLDQVLSKASTEGKDPSNPSLPSNLELLAILDLEGEIRPHVKQTLDNFKRAGVQLKIISGDNPEAVNALAQQINLGQNLKFVSGLELGQPSKAEWQNIAEEYSIFGRISPEQKQQLITALKENGHYVAMVGDGVNDVLALKQANLAISMQSGSQASRNIADIILMQDSFEALPQGLLEGQKIRHSLENVFQIYVVRVIYITFLIVAASLASLAFPFTVKQSSLISILTTGIPALGLTLWARPQKPRIGGLIRSVLHFVLPASLTLGLFSTLLFAGFSYISYLNLLSHLPAPTIGNEELLRITILQTVPLIRTALTTFVVFSGLVLIAFASPYFKFFEGGNLTSKDWRPTALASGVGLVYLVLMYVPTWRNFWDLIALNAWQMAIIISTTIIWTLTLRLFWKARLLDRFLSLQLLPDEKS